jgi:hypothetical protein
LVEDVMPDIFGDDKFDDEDVDEEGLGDDEFDGDEEAQDNPPVTREEERALENEVSASEGGRAPVRAQRKLVAVFGQNGQVLVQTTVNGRAEGPFRAPTKAEWELLRQRGYFVKGGLSAAPPEGRKVPWGLIALGAAVAAGAGVYYLQQKREEEVEEDAEIVDDGPEDDLEDEDDEDGDE